MTRFVCIHGHFYQPPRENPWLEAIELQDSAYPYHDWNERVTDECYRPNARSRILDDRERITQIVNNYARISFNFGPTVLSWMERYAPDVYAALLAADRRSLERFGGHGSAIAQAYGHIIMPLANERDRRTQVEWGLRDFEHRFGRRSEGMWLPETAADTATLEALAEHDVKYTILAPSQARRVKSRQGGRWAQPRGGIDPSRAYLAQLPSGRSISLFFYDGPISQAVAFEGLLNSGHAFARRILTGFNDKRTWPQLMHIATDGETYGHHHRHGDMALASGLDYIDDLPDVELTNYGQFLEWQPPTHLVEIWEGSAWSCAHGVERWRSDCGCHTGGEPGWNQAWRAPLRDALDGLRDAVAPRFEDEAGRIFRDPWEARDDYIRVLLDRSPKQVESFLADHAAHPLDADEQSRALRLLELQRHAMLMYTSCGWFFNDLAGVETVQIMRYAGRVIQLAGDLFDADLEGEFLSRLEQATSNVAEEGSGRDIYDRCVRPAALNLEKVGAHFALSSLFEDYEQAERIYCYDVEWDEVHRHSAGLSRLHLGRVRLTSTVTLESALLNFAVISLADHVISGAVEPYREGSDFDQVAEELIATFDRADFGAILRVLDTSLSGPSYSLASLFRDEQRRVVDTILRSTQEEVETIYRNLYARFAPLMRFLGGLNIPAPPALQMPADFVLNARVREQLHRDVTDVARLRELIDEATDQTIRLDVVTLRFEAESAVERLAGRINASPGDANLIDRTHELVSLLLAPPFSVDLAGLQNTWYALLQDHRPRCARAAEAGDEEAARWVRIFDRFGALLGMQVPTAPRPVEESVPAT